MSQVLSSGQVDTQATPVRILMIDDDAELTAMVGEDLERYGFQVEAFHSGEDGLARLQEQTFALVILDVMLPLMNGFETLSHLRQFSKVPVLMLTARGNPMDVALGFRMGSDDYLAKPFRADELVLRIQAILRRSYSSAATSGAPSAPSDDRASRRLGEVELALNLRRVYKSGVEVDLTSAEFEVLKRLFETPGEIVSRQELCRIALRRELNPFDRSVDNLMTSLRKKLSYGDERAACIRAARGRGYFYSAS